MKDEFTKYIGVPYKHAGRDTKGLDCWGLIILIYKELLNFELLDIWDYEKHWSKTKSNLFLDNYNKHFKQTEKPKKFDLIFFHSKVDKEQVIHAGVYIGKGDFIHCMSKLGTNRAKLCDWKSVVYGYYRLIK
jgi:cell wall-associated NlpC family hydrolase